MQTRQLGSTDLHLSVIGMGTWALGGQHWAYGWGPQEERDSVEAIHEAVSYGVNWIDTAPVYGFGVSEEVVGRVLKALPRPIIVATKCGLVRSANGTVVGDLRETSLRKEIEASLRRLQRDTIDLYQIHWPNPDSQIEAAFETLLNLQGEGKIRWPAVSNFSSAQLNRLSRLGPVAAVQSPYSFLERRVEKEVLPWCRDHQVGVLAYSPLQTGIFTDKFSIRWAQSLPESDWRRNKSPYFKPTLLPSVERFVSSLRSIAREIDVPVSSLAVAWTLRRQEVTSAIVGLRRKGQIEAVLQAPTLVLRESTLNNIEAAFDVYVREQRSFR